MALSNDLISQFAKVVNNEPAKKTETTVYGTIKISDGKAYVQIDGSTVYTPISSTTDVSDGDRVTVMIKDHSAVVTGNMTSPSAKKETVDKVETDVNNKINEFGIIIADKVSTKDLEAERARIDDLTAKNLKVTEELTAAEAKIGELEADNVKINGQLTAHSGKFDEIEATFVEIDGQLVAVSGKFDELEATDAEFRDLKADYGEFKSLTTDKFEATDAEIERLNTDKLSAEEADLKYANIDFANIGDAALQNFFAKSGLIEDVVIGNGTITGTIVGVTFKGDLIQGNTVVADKLVIKGEDGLYYKLNYDGETIEAEQTDKNSLDGSVITAKSITATKISVDDLVAFDATIGGFSITSDSIYSGVKESINNTTTGVYLDNEGQVAFGDGTNFLKYHKFRTYYLVNYVDDNYVVTGETVEAPYVKKYYLVEYTDGVYTNTTEVVDSLDGDLVEDALTESGEQVYLDSVSGTYYCIVTTDTEAVEGASIESGEQVYRGFVGDTEVYYVIQDAYKLEISAASIVFRNGSSVEQSLNDLNSDLADTRDALSQEIKDQKSDYQKFLTKFSKYIRFMEDEDGNPSDTALTIGSGDSAITLEIDNESGIVFKKNGVQFGWWDGVDFHTGNIVVNVNERAQFGNFAYVPRSDGSLSFLKVGG